MNETCPIQPYPKIDHKGHPKFVKYPVERDGKWYAADVQDGGYTISELAIGMPDLEQCQKACDSNNEWEGYPEHDADAIIEWSTDRAMEVRRKGDAEREAAAL